MNAKSEVQQIYKQRFESKRDYREKVWRVLVRSYFQRYISITDTVLDLGSGYGEFSRVVECGKKYALDLNPDGKIHVPADCLFINQSGSDLWPFSQEELDVVFSSNFFEHLPDKTALGQVLDRAAHHLKSGGLFIAIGPNIARVPGRYWDFWDHHIPLTEKSLAEALRVRGFRICECRCSFLPYTMEHNLKFPSWVIALYLKLQFLWPLFGRQFLVVAKKI